MLVGKRIGPYIVEKELGAGAMGTVYRGREAESGTKVAIKVIALNLTGNKTASNRFEREIAILKQLKKHPNIVKVLASGTVQGTRFFVMEYVEGESLDHVMERRGRISWEELIPLGQQLCAALQHAHDKGIIHRDLKPANVMMLKDGTVKLTDFGIAKDIDVTALTAANSTVGTAAYMSPEQCRGSLDISPQSDLYSMGVMFFELITGRKPFLAETIMDMFRQHTEGPFPRPSKLVLDIPIGLDKLICQLLEKKPEDRPYNATKVAEALGKVKEKWEAQQSAGLDAAKKRRADRTKNDTALDETDKALALTMLGKKKKKKAVPFYTRGWFTITSVLAVLAGVSWLIWFLLKPPTADALYAQAEKSMRILAEPSESKIGKDQLKELHEAQSSYGPLGQFLHYYPKDPRAKKIQDWSDQVDRIDCERFMNSFPERLVNNAAELGARQARIDEIDGNLAAARANWTNLLGYKDGKDASLRPWALVAEKHLSDITAAEMLYPELKAKYEKSGKKAARIAEPKTRDEFALNAVRAEEENKSADKAKQGWVDLQKFCEKQDDMHIWQLLAQMRIREIDADAKRK